jgi:HSP20 family protein
MHLDELQTLVPAPGAWLPAVDLCEMAEAVLVRVELPGVAPDAIRVTIRDDLLKIEGRKEPDVPATEQGGPEKRPLCFLCLERAYGSFSRSLLLKWAIDPERVSARLENGVLQIHLAKAKSCGREIVVPIEE